MSLRARARALAAVLVALLACTTAFAQTARPSATAAASAPSARATAAAAPGAAASGSAAALPPGHPPTGDMPPGHPPTGDLPPGHPPTGDMPPGHPPTGGDDPDGEPHGGARGNPHGGGDARRQQLFDAPPDTAEDDPTLPPGTIVLTLRDAEEKPIPATVVTLGMLHNTVATGESREKKTATTDGEGSIRWDALPFGSGTSYRVSVAQSGAQFGTDPFALGDRSGKRVLLHVYPVTSNLDEALVGTQGLVYLALREDSIVIEHMFGIFNLGSVAWLPQDATIDLPEGYKAFNRPDSMEGVGIDEVNGKGVLRGTIGPGRHDVSYRFQVPLEHDERQKIVIELPPHVAQMRVMVESSKTMGVEVPGFPAAKKNKNRDGKRILVTEKMVGREDGGLKRVEVTLTGLPSGGSGRWFAALLGVVAMIGGLAYAQQRRSQGDRPDEETRGDLVAAREALLREILALERAHRAGDIGPKTYQRLKNGLLDALERLVVKIAAATPKQTSLRRRPAVADESEA